MATKKATGPVSPSASEQPKSSEQHIEIGQLRAKHRISAAIFAGVCSAQGWKPGKTVTEAEFRSAVQAFTSAPMGRATKEATK